MEAVGDKDINKIFAKSSVDDIKSITKKLKLTLSQSLTLAASNGRLDFIRDKLSTIQKKQSHATAFKTAIRLGQYDIVKYFLENGTNVSHCSSVLEIAIDNNHINVISLLLEKYKNITKTTCYKLIKKAVETKKHAIVKLLIDTVKKYDIDVNIYKIWWIDEIIEEIVSTSDLKMIDTIDSKSLTHYLSHSIKSNKKNVVKYILDKKVISKDFIQTLIPLSNCLDMIKFIVETTQITFTNASCLSNASTLEIFKYIYSNFKGKKSHILEYIEHYVSNNNIDIVQFVISETKPSIQDIKSIMNKCIFYQRFTLADFIFNMYPMLERQTFYKYVFLDEHQLEILKYFSEYLTSYFFIDILKDTVVSGKLKCLQYLVSRGIDIHIDNEILLQRAVEYGHNHIAYYLVSIGADINIALETIYQAIPSIIQLKNLQKIEHTIFKGTLTDRTETACGICNEDFNKSIDVILQCPICHKCIHHKCQAYWGTNCIYCRGKIH